MTVYGGRRRLVRALGVRGLDAIVVLVVDDGGVVRWLGRGPFTATAGEAVRTIVESRCR